MRQLPVIDVGPLCARTDARGVARQMRHACESLGFFYVVGHAVDESLQRRLAALSRDFFSRDRAEKMRIRMELGGRAWRGYFPPGAELTSGRPDLKEGIYFGAELGDDHPLVCSETPLHGRNLFPEIEGFREVVLDYLAAMTRLGHALMRGMAGSLGLDEDYFERLYTAEPLILFRIFNYPPPADGDDWGVGEHTDYGLLTILGQDEAGGLEVKAGSKWIAAPPIDGSFLCNLGDMLDRMTGGRYRSTPHRVRNSSGRPRLSFPFFFDPSFAAEVKPVDAGPIAEDRDERWDGASVHDFRGTYGDYLLGKVAKVFPALRQRVL